MPGSKAIETLTAHQLSVFLVAVVAMLGLALVFGRLATRWGMPSIAGELLVGVLIGPSCIGAFAPALPEWLFAGEPGQYKPLDALGQVGVILLVGLTGVQMDLGLARRSRRTLTWVSVAGLVTPFSLGVVLALLLPSSLIPMGVERGVFCLFLGTAMSVSAIPVIAKTLMDLNLFHRNVGQLTLAAGMVDDAFGWLMLSLTALAAAGGLTGGAVGVHLLVLAGLVVVSVVVLRPLVRLLLARVAAEQRPELMVGSVVLLLLAGAAATQALHLEAVMGSFVVGLLISASGQVPKAALGTMRAIVLGVLAPFFFALAGLRIDLGALRHADVALAGIAVLAVAIIGKFAGVMAGARLGGLGRWEGLAVAAGMNARGVIEIVVATTGLRLGIIGVEMYTVIVLMALATSFMAPPILRFATSRIVYTAEERIRHDRLVGSSQT